MARGHGWLRAIRERAGGNLDELYRSLEYVEARRSTSNALMGFALDPRFQEVQRAVQEEIEKSKSYLADMDFDDEGDVKVARAITANIKVLRSIMDRDVLKAESKLLAEKEVGIREAIEKIEKKIRRA